jgi:hypothetical protein
MAQVFVVMGGDFPDSVFSSREAAEEYVIRMRQLDNKNRVSGARIHWRYDEFDLQDS